MRPPDDPAAAVRVVAAGAVVAAAAVLPAAPAAAQEEPAPDTVPGGAPDSVSYSVRGLQVEAARPVLTGGAAAAVRLETDSLEVVPSPTLAEVLRNSPLIRVRRNSRGQVQPSLRGMEERQIAVLADNVPLTIGWDNRSDLSVIPMSSVNEVKIVRGLSSVLAGPNALGGVVRIGISQGPFPDTLRSAVDLRSSVDQAGAWALSGQVEHLTEVGDGRLWLKYGGGYRERDGHAAPRGLPVAGLGEGGEILNSDMQMTNGFAAARYQADGGAWLSLSSAGYRAERGVVPELHLLGGPDPEPRFWRYPVQWQSFTSVSGGTGWRETPLGGGDLEASLGLDLRHLEIDSYAGPTYADSVEGETGDDRTLSFRLLGDHSLGPGTLSASFTWAETRHEQTLSTAPGDPEDFRQRLGSVGLEVTRPLAPGDTGGWIADPRVTLGASYDWSSNPEIGDVPPDAEVAPEQFDFDGWGLRASSRVTLLDGLVDLHGGVSRKFRFPALRELFSGALGKFAPNPDLGPLELKVHEVGTTWRVASGLEVQGTFFQQRLNGAIVRAVLPGGLFQRQNRGQTRATGVEVAANWRSGGVTVRGDLTLQEVTLFEEDDRGNLFESPDERAEYQPEVAGNLHVSAPVGLGLRARGELELVGSQFGANPETGEFVELDPTAYLEAGLSRGLGRGFPGLPPVRVAVVAENLTDEMIPEQLGLPRPGRTVRLQVELR